MKLCNPCVHCPNESMVPLLDIHAMSFDTSYTNSMISCVLDFFHWLGYHTLFAKQPHSPFKPLDGQWKHPVIHQLPDDRN